MMEYSKEMVTCVDTLSQLSPMELIDLAEAIKKERKARASRRCKEQIIEIKEGFNKLWGYYDCLEIETENGMMDIPFADILKALDRLYDLY